MFGFNQMVLQQTPEMMIGMREWGDYSLVRVNRLPPVKPHPVWLPSTLLGRKRLASPSSTGDRVTSYKRPDQTETAISIQLLLLLMLSGIK